jgi:putative membrane protein
MEWHAHPDAIVMAVLLLGLYAAGARWAASRTRPRPHLSGTQVALYTGGVLVLYLGAGSPIHDISERYLLSVHMFQHLLFTLVGPPLMLLGIPRWMADALLQPRALRRAMYAITRPMPAFLAFNVFTIATHLPLIGNYALEQHWFHFLLHVVMVTTALLMWMPVLSPTPLLPRLGAFAQLIYLFVQSLVPGVVASFLVFASEPLYQFYMTAPARMWGLSVVDDQRWAAVLMKLAGSAIIWTVMAVIFFRWFADDSPAPVQPAPARTDLSWSDVEAELERMGLTSRATKR